MEDWQRSYIVDKRRDLVTFTCCSLNLTCILRSEGLLTEDDLSVMNAILKSEGERKQVDKLYEILSTRTNAYEVLMKALFETKQTGAGNILKDGIKYKQKYIKTPTPPPSPKYLHKKFSDESPSEASTQMCVTEGAYSIVDTVINSPYDSSYEVPKQNIKIAFDQKLGSGMFGNVYKAVIFKRDRPVDVALKMTRSNGPANAMQDLISEIKILAYLGKHPNVVSIMGACTAEQDIGEVYLATELCSLGSLEDYLRNNEMGSATDERLVGNGYEEVVEENISFRDMVQWSREIASGMEFLGTKSVVHADLATRNVLLTSERTAKISDFGLSRRMYNYQNYVKTKQGPIPWKWMAIESLKRHEFSPKSDVWSFGVTLWEIFSMGDVPYSGQSMEYNFVYKLVDGLRLQCPVHASNEIYEIMTACWYMDPRKRPTFSTLMQQLGNIN